MHILPLIGILILSLVTRSALGQEEISSSGTTQKVVYSLYAGLNYSHLRLQSSPYYLSESDELGEVSVINKPGISGGIYLLFPRSNIRASVEATVMPSVLRYETGGPVNETRWIYPFTFEVPVVWISPPFLGSQKERKLNPSLIAGGRMVIPVSSFIAGFPAQTPVSLNADGGIRFPVEINKSSVSIELIYSLGLMSIIDQHTDDFRNKSIQFLARDFIGLRLYFD
jgi:hypothetical protein